MFQIGLRFDVRAFALRHLFAIDGQESVNSNLRWQIVTSRFKHARPKQRVKVNDVLANEMMDLTIRVLPPFIELLAVGVAPLLC